MSFFAAGRNGFIRPGGSVTNPFFKISKHPIRKLFFRGHLKVGIVVADRFDEKAVFRIPHFDGGSAVPSAKQMLKVIDLQAGFQFFSSGAVAFVAFPGSYRGFSSLLTISRSRKGTNQIRTNTDTIFT